MSATTATVLSVSERSLRLRVDAGAACARCAAGRGCGAGVFGTGRTRELELARPATAQFVPGDRVTLALPARRLLRASLLAYGLPLLTLLAVPLAAEHAFGPYPDAWLAALAAAALGLSLVAGRRLLARDRCLSTLVPEIAGRARASR